jgi:hypothetical protein
MTAGRSASSPRQGSSRTHFLVASVSTAAAPVLAQTLRAEAAAAPSPRPGDPANLRHQEA